MNREVTEQQGRVGSGGLGSTAALSAIRLLVVLMFVILVAGGAVLLLKRTGGAKDVAAIFESGFPANLTPSGIQPERVDIGVLKGPSDRSRRGATEVLLERVLAPKQPGDADTEAITGTNWISVARWEQSHDVCLCADAWQKCVQASINKKDVSIEKCAARLKTWPPALYHFSQTRTFSRKFMEDVITQLERDGNNMVASIGNKSAEPTVQNLALACALYESSVYMNSAGFAGKWRATATSHIGRYLETHQKPDGTIDGDVTATLKVIELLSPVIEIAGKSGIRVQESLSPRIQSSLEFLMYYLDMQGCLPFVAAPDYYSSNKRESLFWAAKAFDRGDFAWVAYGGLDMLDARQPAKTSKAFPDAGIYVTRSNWEIRPVVRRKPLYDWEKTGETEVWAHQLRYMSHTLHLDAKKGVISFSAFGRPQMLMRLPFKDIAVSEWRETADGVRLKGKSGKNLVQVAQLTDFNSWVVWLDSMGDESEVKIEPLLQELKHTVDGDGIVSDLGQKPHTWEPLQHLRLKEYGTICVRTDGRLIQDEQNKDFRIGCGDGKSSLGLVFLPATRTGAEDRKVSFVTDGCVFENDIWCQEQKLPPVNEEGPRKHLFRHVTTDNGWVDNKLMEIFEK